MRIISNETLTKLFIDPSLRWTQLKGWLKEDSRKSRNKEGKGCEDAVAARNGVKLFLNMEAYIKEFILYFVNIEERKKEMM